MSEKENVEQGRENPGEQGGVERSLEPGSGGAPAAEFPPADVDAVSGSPVAGGEPSAPSGLATAYGSMTEDGSLVTAGEPTKPVRPGHVDFLRAIFVGPNGIRAGWRLLIYACLLMALSTFARLITRAIFGRASGGPPSLEPLKMFRMELTALLIIVAASLIMALIEREKWGRYGLPPRRMLSGDFVFGCAWGFVGLSCVIGVMRVAGAYRIEGLAVSGAVAVKYALLWGAVFLLVGLFEEFLLRGYALYTLASGVTFWPAAVLTSAFFLMGHVSNPGENWYGLADVFVIGMFFCFTLWRTGDLWFAVGLHAAWDWGQSYFYSVADSGLVASGHLFRIHMQGPAWLTGGSVGPEGSALSLASHVVYFALFALIFRERKWVGKTVVSRWS